jgi:hypothetical protein
MAMKWAYRFFTCFLLLWGLGACSSIITYDGSINTPAVEDRAMLFPLALKGNKPIDFLDSSDGRLTGFCEEFPCEYHEEVTLDISESDLKDLLAGIVSCLSEVEYKSADPLYDTWSCPASGLTGDCEDRACVTERCAIARGVPPGAVTFLYAMRPPKGETRDADHMAVLLRTTQGWFVIDTGKLSHAMGLREWVSVRKFKRWILMVRTVDIFGTAQWRAMEVVPMRANGREMAQLALAE